jgi:HEAT repeat protein
VAVRQRWTPRRGARDLVARLGREAALEQLADLLLARGGPPGPDVGNVLEAIGDGHARRLLAGAPGTSLGYWPRAWAARALRYVGGPAQAPALRQALGDAHWRVRMNATGALSATKAREAEGEIAALLRDPHWRVREAAARALGRLTRDPQLAGALQQALADPDERVQSAAAAALIRLESAV